VHRAATQRFQDEHVQRSGEQIGSLSHTSYHRMTMGRTSMEQQDLALRIREVDWNQGGRRALEDRVVSTRSFGRGE
jgi:hypothetical protein